MSIQTNIKMLIDSGMEPNEAQKEIQILLEHFCNYTQLDKCKGVLPDEKQMDILSQKVRERIETRKPIQYITGEAYFMGEFFKVTPDVLIPRDETEILVTKAVEIINKNKLRDILDIGTGSGCIACTIAKRTDSTVLGIDISSDALRVALDNVTRLGINNRAVFRKSNLFEKIRAEEKFDMIVSNPPYIPEGTVLQEEVKHEPKCALFAGKDGLEYYSKIIDRASEFLKSEGWLMFELGLGESRSVKALMERDFNNIKIEKDLAGIDRIIYAQKRK